MIINYCFDEYGEDFEFEINKLEELDALSKIIYEKYFYVKGICRQEREEIENKILKFINDVDLIEKLEIEYIDELKDFFEDDARELNKEESWEDFVRGEYNDAVGRI